MVPDPLDIRMRLVSALISLHKSGRASWSRQQVEPEFIYCFVDGDLIRFELSQGKQPFEPTQPVGGIVCVIRNCHLLWLEGSPGWDELLALLQAVPIQSDCYAEMLRSTQEAAMLQLERLAGSAR